MHRTLPGTILLIALLPAPLHAQARAPTAQDARMCRLLAYENYPQQRPGKSPGSGARYQFYKDCLAKRAGGEPPPKMPENPR